MQLNELTTSRNKIISILEKDGETVIYHGKFKNIPELGDVEVLSVNEYGMGLAIILDFGATKEEKVEAKKELRRSTNDFKRMLLATSMMFGGLYHD